MVLLGLYGTWFQFFDLSSKMDEWSYGTLILMCQIVVWKLKFIPEIIATDVVTADCVRDQFHVFGRSRLHDSLSRWLYSTHCLLSPVWLVLWFNRSDVYRHCLWWVITLQLKSERINFLAPEKQFKQSSLTWIDAEAIAVIIRKGKKWNCRSSRGSQSCRS